jgi:hypothetical protein
MSSFSISNHAIHAPEIMVLQENSPCINYVRKDIQKVSGKFGMLISINRSARDSISVVSSCTIYLQKDWNAPAAAS